MELLAAMVLSLLGPPGESLKPPGLGVNDTEIGLLISRWETEEENDHGEGYGLYLRVNGLGHPNLDIRISGSLFEEMGEDRKGHVVDLELMEFSATILWRLSSGAPSSYNPYIGGGASYYKPDFEIHPFYVPPLTGELKDTFGFHFVAGVDLLFGRGTGGFLEFTYRWVELEAEGDFFDSDTDDLTGAGLALGVNLHF